MKKRILAAFLALAMVITLLPSLTLPARAVTPDWATGGTGEATDPYIISSYQNLKKFAEEVNSGATTTNKFYKLADNFPTDAGPLTTPIGKDSKPFVGVFDGNGKTVTLNISGVQYAGLFGYVGSSGTVRNVGTTGTGTAQNGGTSYAGGVAGQNDGTVTNCYATGTVTAQNGSMNFAGGVAGENYGEITNCYVTGTVTAQSGGMSYAGGVAGTNGGTVTNCYAAGKVTGTRAGGVVGIGYEPVTGCYYLMGIASYGVGVNSSSTPATAEDANTTPLSKAQMQAASGTADGAEWKATVGSSKCALVDALNSYAKVNGYAAWKVSTGEYPTFVEYDTSWFDATKDEFVLENTADLEGLAMIVNGGIQTGGEAGSETYGFAGKTVKLAKDFDGAVAFTTPIGSYRTIAASMHACLDGTFDGNGQTVKLDIYLTSTGSVYAGLFGENNGGTVKNVSTKGTVKATSSATAYAGGVVGYNLNGKVTNCCADVEATAVSGCSVAGGVAAKNHGGTVTNCYAVGDVAASGASLKSAGGMVGENQGGLVTNCYATGAVTAEGNGQNNAGGVIGFFNANGCSVVNCYATGDVTATNGVQNQAGGVVGWNMGSAVTNCYAAGAVTGTTAGGVVGKNNGTVSYCYYLDSEVYNGIGSDGDVADSTTALTQAQMQAASGTTKLAWTEISGSKRPLVDALNSYAKANGYASWKVAAKETYPTFMQKIDYELDWFDVDAESYEIKSYAELEALAYIVNSGIRTGGTEDEPTYGFENKTVKLSDKFPTDEGKMTTEIGSGAYGANYVEFIFKGTFDGNDKTVELNIDMTGSRVYAGLFGYLNGAVQNVSTKGTVTANGTSSEAGGVVGNSDYGRVTDCSSECEVTGNTAGGVIGNSSGAVTNCHATGSITGGNAGGVVGENHSTIASCYATGDVAGYNAGGVVGNNTGDGRLINCYAAGNVKGYNAGGVAGNNDRPITNCYATGDVTGTTVGGVVGTISSGVSMITNCYAAGKLEAADTSTSYIGGVVGKFLRDTIITDCYYRKGMAEYGVAAYYYEETTTPATEEDPNTLAMSEANMKAVSGKASLVERLHDYVVKNPDSYLFDWVTDGLRYPVFAENVETASKVKTARLDNLYAIPEDAVLVVGGVKLNGIKYELTENGYLLKNAAGKYLKVSGRQLVTVDAEKDATPWFYNGGLYAVVNVNRGCGGFFRTPHYVKYYLAAAPNGVAYASLLFAPAVAQYEGLVMVDAAVSLDYTVSTAVVGALKKYSYTFTVNAPENAEVYYKIGTVESFGRTFTMLYKPAFVYIRIVNDGVSTNWKATLTRTGYEVSYVG